MATNTIILRGVGKGINKEAIAAVAITPGMLVDTNSEGGLIPHATASGTRAQKAFARELEMFGKDIDTDYAISDTTLYTVLPPGAEVYAFVEAGAASIVAGDGLESAGDGTLQKVSAGLAVGQALGAIDNSSGTTKARLKVVVL